MTREEAIEDVRKNLPHLGIGATEMTDALGTLIPELRESEDESEDERIREWLVYYFKAIGKSWLHHRDISIEQILAYLEKQKEQKPVSISCGHENDGEVYVDERHKRAETRRISFKGEGVCNYEETYFTILLCPSWQ